MVSLMLANLASYLVTTYFTYSIVNQRLTNLLVTLTTGLPNIIISLMLANMSFRSFSFFPDTSLSVSLSL